jgi:hypothetical protein
MFKDVKYVDGFRFTQEMDTRTDTATYRDMGGHVLLTVNSHGRCFGALGLACGAFKLKYPGDVWCYEGEDGQVIETNHTLLFEKAEPEVVAKLFKPR